MYRMPMVPVTTSNRPRLLASAMKRALPPIRKRASASTSHTRPSAKICRRPGARSDENGKSDGHSKEKKPRSTLYQGTIRKAPIPSRVERSAVCCHSAWPPLYLWFSITVVPAAWLLRCAGEAGRKCGRAAALPSMCRCLWRQLSANVRPPCCAVCPGEARTRF